MDKSLMWQPGHTPTSEPSVVIDLSGPHWLARAVAKYSPDQPRDHGKFAEVAGDGATAEPTDLPRELSPRLRHILAAEAQHADAAVEYARAIGRDGNIMLDKTSNAQLFVNFTKEEMETLRDSSDAFGSGGIVFTHNHPEWIGTDGQIWGGYGLSPDDVVLAISTGLTEMRASTSSAVFSMRPGLDGWPPERVLRMWYNDADAPIRAAAWVEIRAGRITKNAASRAFHDDVWRQVAMEHPEHLVYNKEAR
jgi:hypothetical protein